LVTPDEIFGMDSECRDRDFNSLDAQREATESFIASQHHEGWVVLPGQYYGSSN